MALTVSNPGDRITSALWNASLYNLFKGVVGFEDSIRLADNVQGTLLLKPNVAPPTSTQLLQIEDVNGNVLFAVDYGGNLTAQSINPTSIPQKVGSQTLTVPAATMGISSIPTGYSTLMLVLLSRSETTGGGGVGEPAQVQFNGDTATNYNFRYVESTSNTASWTNSQGQVQAGGVCGVLAGGGAPSFHYSTSIMHILSYASTSTFKPATWEATNSVPSMTGGVGPALEKGTFEWLNLSAITSAVISVRAGGTFSSASRLDAYLFP